MAEKAIKADYQAKLAKGSLELKCQRCTLVEFFPGLDKVGAYAFAVRSGWRFSPDADGKEQSTCPQCSGLLNVANA
jgi:hypothetical protein